jgi:hypothetical protein
MNEDAAKQILVILDEASARLNEVVRLAQAHSSEDEFHRVRRTVGRVMGDLHLDVGVPIFDTYPDLVPKTFRPWRSEKSD